MSIRRCRLCNTPFKGRRDKIFCTTACKSDYHRKLTAMSNQIALPTDKILHRNRAILYEVMGENTEQKKLVEKLWPKRISNLKILREYMKTLRENAII